MFALVNYYLYIDGIRGEITRDCSRYDTIGEIQLKTWSFGVFRSTNCVSENISVGTDPVTVSEIKCTAPTSKATPFIFHFCVTGKQIETARLSACRTGLPGED